MYIAVEGIDGAGKGLFVKWLTDTMEGENYIYLVREFPTKGLGKAFSMAKISNRPNNIPEEAFPYIVDIAQDIPNHENIFFISDRSILSTVAYNSANHPDITGDPVEYPDVLIWSKILKQYARYARATFKTDILPDLVIYINNDIDTALENIESRKRVKSKYENRKTLKQAADVYTEILHSLVIPAIIVDNTHNKADMEEEAYRIFNKILERRNEYV